VSRRRRYRRRPDLDSPFWWAGALIVVMFWVLAVSVWLVWAVVALSVAGIAKLAHNDDLASAMTRSLRWQSPGRGSSRARSRR
jgi:hypothetical protein